MQTGKVAPQIKEGKSVSMAHGLSPHDAPVFWLLSYCAYHGEDNVYHGNFGGHQFSLFLNTCGATAVVPVFDNFLCSVRQ